MAATRSMESLLMGSISGSGDPHHSCTLTSHYNCFQQGRPGAPELEPAPRM